MDFDIYDLRQINKQPPTNATVLFSDQLRTKRHNYRLGKTVVNGEERVYRRDLTSELLSFDTDR